MIRRVFWLLLGAVAGVASYRRAARLAHALSPGVRAREVAGFAADVRRGMDLYMQRHPRPLPLTLEDQPLEDQRARAQRPGTGAGRPRPTDTT